MAVSKFLAWIALTQTFSSTPHTSLFNGMEKFMVSTSILNTALLSYLWTQQTHKDHISTNPELFILISIYPRTMKLIKEYIDWYTKKSAELPILIILIGSRNEVKVEDLSSGTTSITIKQVLSFGNISEHMIVAESFRISTTP